MTEGENKVPFPSLLQVDSINTYYGQSHILHSVSLRVDEKKVVSLLGRNGVGKTTTIRSIMGLTPPASGRITFKGVDISNKPPYFVARLGIGYVPEDRRIFPDLTLYENLELSRRLSPKKVIFWTYDRLCEIFQFYKTLKDRKGSQLSGGEQKMLAIGRALIKDPDLLILDEPSEGLAPLIVQNLGKVLERIKAEGVTILLADQNVKFCKRISDEAYILEKGQVKYFGTMQEIWENQELVQKYLAV